MQRTLAIVEDEAAIRENYRDAFQRYGFNVHTYRNRPEAEAAFAGRLPDVVIIDVGLEDEMEGGFELCRQLRSRSRTLPVIFLTARDSDFDVISGLRLGADDYLTKDISLPLVVARVMALLRRVEALSGEQAEEEGLQRGDLNILTERMEVAWKQQPLELTVTEFWLVYSLARRPGHVRTRQQLMDDANLYVDEQTVTSHIKRIRRKFEQVDDDFDSLETVYGAGYRWRVPKPDAAAGSSPDRED